MASINKPDNLWKVYNNLAYINNWNNQKIALVASDQDIASLTIAKQVENKGFDVFYIKGKSFLSVSDEDLPECDNYIVLSRHSSAAKEPAFTVHSVGNFSPDEPRLGGLPSELGITNADIQTFLLYSLKKCLTPEFSSFDVVAEATHHGPLLSKSVTFIEMGSSPEVWESQKAANLLAEAIDYFFNSLTISEFDLSGAIGFGGGHYPRKISDQIANLGFSVGHLCPKYNLPFIDENMVDQMKTKTISKNRIEFALFDKKGMNRKQEIRKIVENLDLEVIEL